MSKTCLLQREDQGKGRGSLDERKARYDRVLGLTTGIHMSLDLLNELPNLRTSLRVLEAERVVDAVGFCPHDQGLCGGRWLALGVWGDEDTRRTRR